MKKTASMLPATEASHDRCGECRLADNEFAFKFIELMEAKDLKAEIQAPNQLGMLGGKAALTIPSVQRAGNGRFRNTKAETYG